MDGARARARNALDAPIVDLRGASRLVAPRDDGRFLGYRELAHALADYVLAMGFTHVELMPITEHPFYGSWGYQTTGYFAPTARYGTPQDFMYFVDHLHQRGIGVILDWVPSHFPTDEHGLAYFDGTHLYEHADPRQGFHPEWNSSDLQLRPQRGARFLLSSALFWLERVSHRRAARRCGRLDALPRLRAQARRVDPEPLRRPREPRGDRTSCASSTSAVYRDHPDVQTIAEESTAWPMVSRPDRTSAASASA